MQLSFIIRVFVIVGCLMAYNAWASEDSGEYPFPDDFSFDDLPEIEELPPPEDFETPVPSVKDSSVSEKTSSNYIETKNKQLSPKDLPVQISENDAKNTEKVKEPAYSPIFFPQNNTNNTTDIIAVNKDKTLTETLKEQNPEDTGGLLEGTWVEKLASSNPLSLIETEEDDNDNVSDKEDKLEKMVRISRNKNKNGRSNASVFDISGVMLRMDLKQVERTLENRGFKRVNAVFGIPNFIKWRNEETCRLQGIVGYERLDSCVISLAKKEGHQYLKHLKFAKFDSKEEIDVYFTSNFTGNKVYKIVYKSTIASITGNSPKAIYLRNIKVYDFWKKISQKYGDPDNKTTVTWGLGGDKPYLKAFSTGNLLLEDPMFKEMDHVRMSLEDQRFINSDFYNF